MSIKRDKSVEFPQRQTAGGARYGQSDWNSPRSVRWTTDTSLTLSQLPEHQLGSLQLVLVRDSLGEREGRSESGSELKDGLGRTSEGVTLLPEEDVCVPGKGYESASYGKRSRRIRRRLTVLNPVLGQGETLAESSVLVSLGEHPGRVHEILATEVSSDLLVPESDVTRAIIGDVPQLVVGLERIEEVFHPVDTLDEVLDPVLVVLYIRPERRISFEFDQIRITSPGNAPPG